MSTLREVIDFAQSKFGNNNGVPSLPEGRPPLPPWLEGRIESAARIEEGDSPVIEGSPDGTTEQEEPREGASLEELFAYYLPFHFYQAGWGIYIRAYGIDGLARLLTSRRPLTPGAVSFAFRLLLEHERLHFLAEVAAAKLEVALRQSSYKEYFPKVKAALHEEAVANAWALSSCKRGVDASLLQAASSWMKTQGPGYCDFREWQGSQLRIGYRRAAESMSNVVPSLVVGQTSNTTFMKVGDDVLTTMVARQPSSVPPIPHTPGWPGEFLFEERRRMHPPIYLVVDIPVPLLRVVRPFPKQFGLQVLVHTNDHKPPHIHINVLKGGRETRYE